MDLVSRNLGLITTIAWRHWAMLPPEVHGYMDMEDLVSDIAVQLWRVQKSYQAFRGKESTFVGTVAANHCKTLVTRYRYLKKNRTTGVLSLSNENVCAILRAPHDPGITWVRAKEPVERIIADASTGLRRGIAHFLEHRRGFPKKHLDEFRLLARRHSLSYIDLLTVLVQS